MADPVLHPTTAENIHRFISTPSHALLITGSTGSGKAYVAQYITQAVLNLPPEKLENYPYLTTLAPIEGKQISIEQVRELQHVLALSVPGARAIARIIIVEQAHKLTVEAQNALLKTLEEPPADTLIILAASSPEALLATIRSRVQEIRIIPPAPETLKTFFAATYDVPDIDKAMLVSGGLPGLTNALLSDQASHPLYEATLQARGLLQAKAYDRLTLVDKLSKQKQLCQDICFILGQMSRMALKRGAGGAAGSPRWQKILRASFEAEEQLQHNAQPKLVLMNLMLEL